MLFIHRITVFEELFFLWGFWSVSHYLLFVLIFRLALNAKAKQTLDDYLKNEREVREQKRKRKNGDLE
jgi:hypothetical protein